MPTLTIRNLPVDLVDRIKERARQHGRSMESEVREMLHGQYASRQEALDRIKARWKDLPQTTAAEIQAWREEGRS